MKYIGMILVIICTTLMGYNLSLNIKNKANICTQLILLCDRLITDFNSTLTPIIELIEKLLNQKEFDKLDFISVDNILHNKKIVSVLDDELNERISNFLYSLGKSDLYSQINNVNNFREYIKISEKNYLLEYYKYKKLYVTVGFLIGVCVAIIFV